MKPDDTTIQERRESVEREFERYRTLREQWMRKESVSTHWAKHAWLADAKRDEMGRELAKAQARIGRQRKANREQHRALMASEARCKELEEALEHARLDLTSLHGLYAFDGAAPSEAETWQLDNNRVIDHLDRVLDAEDAEIFGKQDIDKATKAMLDTTAWCGDSEANAGENRMVFSVDRKAWYRWLRDAARREPDTENRGGED